LIYIHIYIYIYDVGIRALQACMPGSLYAICNAHQNDGGLRVWRARSHALMRIVRHGKMTCMARGAFLDQITEEASPIGLV